MYIYLELSGTILIQDDQHFFYISLFKSHRFIWQNVEKSLMNISRPSCSWMDQRNAITARKSNKCEKCFKKACFWFTLNLLSFPGFLVFFFLPWASILRWLNCFLFILDVRHRSRSKSTVSIGKLFFSID